VDQLVGLLGQRDTLVAVITPHVGPMLRERMPQMGDASLFNMVSAIVAARTPGLAGELTFRIPRKVNDRMEVCWRSAPMD
jgi:hypothetical protein